MIYSRHVLFKKLRTNIIFLLFLCYIVVSVSSFVIDSIEFLLSFSVYLLYNQLYLNLY